MKRTLTDKEFITFIVHYIFQNDVEAVQFIPNEYTINLLQKYLKNKEYEQIMYSFGYKFLLRFNEICEYAECYEICNDIKKAIDNHNELVKDKIPTRI